MRILPRAQGEKSAIFQAWHHFTYHLLADVLGLLLPVIVNFQFANLPMLIYLTACYLSASLSVYCLPILAVAILLFVTL